MAHDVFISYSSKDKTIADGVCARLEVRGIRCWIAPRDVQPGLPYGEEIIDAIHNCRAMVLVLSSNANASTHIPKEIERAVSCGVPVIPLRIEDVLPGKSLDYFISSVHWLDAITPPLEQHVDSLANTLRTLLPEGTRQVPPQPEQATRPTPNFPAQSSVAPAVTAQQKPKWLVPAIAVTALALAAAWFIWGRTPNPTPTILNANTPDATPKTQKTVSIETDPEKTMPHAVEFLKATAGQAVVGCWHWFNNGSVVLNADGSAVGGPFSGHWQVANAVHHTYEITWPEAVDTVAISPDGRTLGGGNQYGIGMSASRQTLGSGIAGSWRWYNGATVTIREDGTFSAQQFSGRWQMTGPGTYLLTWPGPVDTLTLSADQKNLNGSNQYGFHISGTKGGC